MRPAHYEDPFTHAHNTHRPGGCCFFSFCLCFGLCVKRRAIPPITSQLQQPQRCDTCRFKSRGGSTYPGAVPSTKYTFLPAYPASVHAAYITALEESKYEVCDNSHETRQHRKMRPVTVWWQRARNREPIVTSVVLSLSRYLLRLRASRRFSWALV